MANPSVSTKEVLIHQKQIGSGRNVTYQYVKNIAKGKGELAVKCCHECILNICKEAILI